jgi:hypothetical protein
VGLVQWVRSKRRLASEQTRYTQARALETLIDTGASPILGKFPVLTTVMVSQPSRAGVEATIRFPAKSKIDLTEVGATTWISLL